MSDFSEIQRICSLLARGEIVRSQFLQLLTWQMAVGAGCSRAGVRMLIDTAKGPALRCAAMYDATRSCLVRVADVSGPGVHVYLEALLRDGCVVAADARTHRATAGLLDTYLRPSDIRSLLDVCLWVNGVFHGTFSCEQLGSIAQWNAHQLHRLRQIAMRASLTLMNAMTAQVDTDPAELWAPSTPRRLMTLPMPLDVEGEVKPDIVRKNARGR